MSYTFSDQAWDDYLVWLKTDRTVLAKINRLIAEASRTPFTGIGEPEPLKHEYAGWWSRRITPQHRMIYRVIRGDLEIARLRSHYSD